MKKKWIGILLLIVGFTYFLAMFCNAERFAAIDETLSYLCFAAMVAAIAVGAMLLLLFQTPEEHEKERAAKQAEEQCLRECSRCVPRIVYLLLGLHVAAFAAVNVLQGADAVPNYAVSKSSAALYRLFTAMLVHVDGTHLLFNMVTLLPIGRRLERLIGHGKFAAVYLISGLASSAALAFFSENPCVGASGAIFGLIGCFLPIAYRDRATVRYTFWQELLPTAAVNLVLSLLLPGISAIAHIAGFSAGLLCHMLFCGKIQITANRQGTRKASEQQENAGGFRLRHQYY